jgi:2-polyprenyl-3-methyl-5-hydroxy-6-metoxy-1,4-benzoquinol methylase
MFCPICKNASINMIFKNFPGYYDSFYDIFTCLNCNTSFIDTYDLNTNIYNRVYNQLSNDVSNSSGYSRYSTYSSEIKNSNNPIKYLIQNENNYFPVYSFIKDKSNLKILDVGCGLGYLTYALNSLGHEVVGIDISESAIKNAKSNFGNFFIRGDLLKDNLKFDNTFDLIIGIELIEHLLDLNGFIKKCTYFLKDGGSMIFTTPNKDYPGLSDSVWFTDSPPVHTLWLSKKSLESISKEHNLKIEFMNSENNLIKNNLLLPYLYDKYIRKNPNLEWSQDISPNKPSWHNIIYILTNLYFIRKISNLIFYKLIKNNQQALFVRFERQ